MDCKRNHTMPTASIISLDNAADDIFKLSAVAHSHCFQRCSLSRLYACHSSDFYNSSVLNMHLSV